MSDSLFLPGMAYQIFQRERMRTEGPGGGAWGLGVGLLCEVEISAVLYTARPGLSTGCIVFTLFSTTVSPDS